MLSSRLTEWPVSCRAQRLKGGCLTEGSSGQIRFCWKYVTTHLKQVTERKAVKQITLVEKYLPDNFFEFSCTYSTCFFFFFVLTFFFNYSSSNTSSCLISIYIFSTKVMGVWVFSSRSEGFLPVGHWPEQKSAHCRSKVINNSIYCKTSRTQSLTPTYSPQLKY